MAPAHAAPAAHAAAPSPLAAKTAAAPSPAARARGDSNAPSAPPLAAASNVPAAVGFFPYEDVKSFNVPGMDPTRREDYIDDATFQAKFGVNRTAFKGLPKWKRDAKKKEVGLF